jgi:hypothetical protein
MSATPPMAPTDWEYLKEIASQGFRSNPRNYGAHVRQQVGGGYENSPIEDMLGSSPLLDYVRQALPNRLGDTALGRALPETGPSWLPQQTMDRIRQAPLGGYSSARQAQFDAARDESPNLRAETVRLGEVPVKGDPVSFEATGDRFRHGAAQAAGVAASDLVGVQGLQNIWWFLNAPQALTTLATLQATYGAGKGLKGDSVAPLLRSRTMRLAATAPAWIGMSFGVGSFGREAGYGAAVPSEADRTVAVNPIAEGAARLFLGRTGQLMPYDEFVKERPDVSKGEYEAYKAYLFGGASPIKATLDGIHGPEVSFLGKSMPVATAILPAAAAALGARYGANRAARRLAGSPDGNLIVQRDRAEEAMRRAEQDPEGSLEAVENATRRYKQLNNTVQDSVLQQTLLYSGGAMAGTGLVGSILEAARRSLKGRAPEEDPELEQPVAAPLAPAAPVRP